MALKSLTIDYEEYDSPEDLPIEDKLLVDAATEAASGSFAPYSNFNVGAALLLTDGTIVKGANQENAAFPSGICAERTAMFAAGATHPGVAFESLAIVCMQNGVMIPSPGYPCGACRQVMAQYERNSGRYLRIIIASSGKTQVFSGVKSLMPFIFTSL